MFITFEGGEGTGKSTQICRVFNYLKELHYNVVKVADPGGTELGSEIRKILLDSTRSPICENAELLLFSAARAQLVHSMILPSLKNNAIVLSDRFADSTMVYQHYVKCIPLKTVQNSIDIGSYGLIPDFTFIFDIDPVIGIKRSLKRLAQVKLSGGGDESRFENESLVFHQKVRHGFQKIALNKDRKFYTISVDNLNEDDVFKLVVANLPNTIHHI